MAGAEHRLAVEFSDDEAAARAKVFAEVVERLESEHGRFFQAIDCAIRSLRWGGYPEPAIALLEKVSEILGDSLRGGR